MTSGTGPGTGPDQTPSEIAYDALTDTTPASTAPVGARTGAQRVPTATPPTGPTAGNDPRTGDRRQQAAAVKDHAQQQAGEVAATAKDQAANVAGTAKEQAGNVLDEAKNQAGDLLGDLRRQLSEQSDGVRDRLAEFLTTAGSELSEMAGAGNGSGYATQVVRQAGDHASSWGSHLTDHDAGDLLAQTRSFARRKPGTFLLGAVVAGVVAGRLTRGAKSHHDETSASDGAPAPAQNVDRAAYTETGTYPDTGAYSAADAIVARTRPTTPLAGEPELFVAPDTRP